MNFYFLWTVASLCISNLFFVNSIAQIKGDKYDSIALAIPVIDKLFMEYATKNHLPGFVYGIVADGKLIHATATGYSDILKRIPATSNTAFRIASMTKSFTAMAILKLRDEGKLSLDDPAYLFIPELKDQKYLTTDAPPITIRHLMTHGAGFPEDNPWGDRQLEKTDSALKDMLKKGISFSNDPGIAYEYSNMGFALLGYIIKKVSGKSYEDYITQNILHPLKMTHTYWEFSLVPEVQLGHGYRWLDKWVEQPMLHDGSYGAMGGMITTLEDFTKYVSFQLSAWPPSSEIETGPIRRSSLRELQHPWNIPILIPQYHYPSGRVCPVVTSYGYGLNWRKDCEGRISVGHNGGLPGFGSSWSMMPDYGIGIIAFANLTYAPASAFNVMALDTLLSISRLQPPRRLISTILNQRKTELFNILRDWKLSESTGIFAENFFMDYFIDSLQKESDNTFKKAGKIIRVRDLVAENNLRGHFIIECEKANVEVSFTLTQENPPLIQEYHLRLKD